MISQGVVYGSEEIRRIVALPRRPEGPPPIEELTARWRTFAGTMRLKEAQARALDEALRYGGLLAPMRVGAGKTLTSFLLFRVFEARRGLLLVPASLARKTEAEFHELSKHWYLGPFPRVVSYEMLGRENSAKLLEGFPPDVIVADEAHRLKNRKAACTRRLSRYLASNPDCRFVAMSGTLVNSGIEDVAHLSAWALRSHSPFPRESDEARDWSDALDVGRRQPKGIGALSVFAAKGAGTSEQERARTGFRAHLRATPGVVFAGGDDDVGASIRLEALEYEVSPETREHFQALREHWVLPCGWELSQSMQVWAQARLLALGFHSVWDPPAPVDWRRKRSAWAAFVRDVLRYSRSLDSELQVRKAHPNSPECAAWEAVRPTFTPHPVDRWHDTRALEVCEAWAKTPGIVWTGSRFFGLELARRTGLSYYGQEGLDDRGRSIEGEDGSRSIIASIAANSTGRNLQHAFHRSLIATPTSSPKTWEQLIGRTHRTGQKADEVIVNVLLGCREHDDSLQKALARAVALHQTTGEEQKILLADRVWPSVSGRSGAEWDSIETIGSEEE